MKTPRPRRIAIPRLLLLAGALAIPTARASDEKPDTPAKKGRPLSESARKYGANHDGKLDDAEQVLRQAEKEQAHAESEIRKRERAERAERETQQEQDERK